MGILSKILELSQDNVFVKDKAKLEAVIQRILQAGKEKLQVITDFDHTLSKYSDDGRSIPTCYAMVESSHLLPRSFREKAVELRQKYYPIEFCPQMTNAEKYPYMVEWWTKWNNLLVQCKVTRNTLRQIVSEADLKLRDGTNWTLSALNKYEVPLLIFSAGIGDLLEEVIKQNQTLYDNTKIVSNYLKYNESGIVIGLKDTLIHTFSKNESALRNSDYFVNLAHRHNVILIGDSVGDCHMADGCPELENLLKIGFLNQNVENLLPKYKDLYDIVLVADETFNVPNAILRECLQITQ